MHHITIPKIIATSQFALVCKCNTIFSRYATILTISYRYLHQTIELEHALCTSLLMIFEQIMLIFVETKFRIRFIIEINKFILNCNYNIILKFVG